MIHVTYEKKLFIADKIKDVHSLLKLFDSSSLGTLNNNKNKNKNKNIVSQCLFLSAYFSMYGMKIRLVKPIFRIQSNILNTKSFSNWVINSQLQCTVHDEW